MRTEIFTEAWRLFKMYNVTFAEALSFAWAKYKSDKLCNTMNLAEALGHKETVKACMSELKELNVSMLIMSVSFKEFNLRVAYVSNGAQHDYMTGRYMAD